MDKKVIYGGIIIIVVIAIILGVVLLMNGKKDENISIDLQALNTTISGKVPFSELATMDITTETLESMYQIKADEVDEVIGKMPMMNVQASMYLVIKAKDGQVDTVKTKVENYAQSYEEQWATYLPAQYELVKQRKLGVKGNYIYLIISENSAELEALVK